jgi:hypothetical protein
VAPGGIEHGRGPTAQFADQALRGSNPSGAISGNPRDCTAVRDLGSAGVCGLLWAPAILLNSAAAGIAIGIEHHLARQIWLWLRTRVPLSRCPNADSAFPRLFWVMAQLRGTRSRVFSLSASR